MQGQVILLLLLHLLGECLQVELTHLPLQVITLLGLPNSITIASKGNSTKFGELTAKHQRPTGASNGIKGLVFSGRDIPDISEISMTSGGVAIHFGNLSVGDYSGFSACNAIRAVHGGG